MINYESVLLSLNASGKLHEPLDLIYPSEGIVTADYPLLLLNDEQARRLRQADAVPALPRLPEEAHDERRCGGR